MPATAVSVHLPFSLSRHSSEVFVGPFSNNLAPTQDLPAWTSPAFTPSDKQPFMYTPALRSPATSFAQDDSDAWWGNEVDSREGTWQEDEPTYQWDVEADSEKLDDDFNFNFLASHASQQEEPHAPYMLAVSQRSWSFNAKSEEDSRDQSQEWASIMLIRQDSQKITGDSILSDPQQGLVPLAQSKKEGSTEFSVLPPELTRDEKKIQYTHSAERADPGSSLNQKRKCMEETSYASDCADDDCAANKKAKRSCSSDRSASPDSGDVQMRARQGQEYWGTKVIEMRARWESRRMWEKDPHFARQVQRCSWAHIKSQHECLLRELQFAKADGLVYNCVFSQRDSDSFIGWKSFRIAKEHAAEFRSRMMALFPTPPLDATLNNVFRRAGLIPDYCPAPGRVRSWNDSWDGYSSFAFSAQKRAVYH